MDQDFGLDLEDPQVVEFEARRFLQAHICQSIEALPLCFSSFVERTDRSEKNSALYVVVSRALEIIRDWLSDGGNIEALQTSQIDIVPFAHVNDGIGPGCEKARRVLKTRQAGVKTKRPTKKQKCCSESISKGCDESQSFASDNMMRSVKETTRPTRGQMCRHRELGESGSGARRDGSSSNLVVKASYIEDTIKMVFACTPSFDELKEEVATKLELDVDEFKIRYLDNDSEWILMTGDSDLQDACDSSETGIVRLTILDI